MSEEGKKRNWFLRLLAACCVLVVFISFYSFYFQKNYNFQIEASCDPTTDICFYRDCETDPSLCPPDNLSHYKKYIIKARDFNECQNDDTCLLVCTSLASYCHEIKCTQDDIDSQSCTVPELNS